MRSRSAKSIERAFAPASAVMARLKYAHKFLLVGVVLFAPLAFVVKSYLDVQSRDTAFAVKEQVGVVYLRPVTELLARVVAERALAVEVATHQANPFLLDRARGQINMAVSAVDSAQDAGRRWASMGSGRRSSGRFEPSIAGR